MNIGENIRKIRKDKNISRKELANRIGYSVYAIEKYEQGQRNPSINALIDISKALNVTYTDLIEGRECKGLKVTVKLTETDIVENIIRMLKQVALDERIDKKKYIYEKYKEAFKDIKDIEMAKICEYGEPNYWLSIGILSPESKVKPLDIILELEKENIESRHIWKPMNMQPFYEKYDFFKDNDNEGISVGEDIFNRGICLPSDTKMSDEEINRVIKIVKGLF